MSIAVHVPDQDGLGHDLAEMHVRLWIADPEPRPEVADLPDTLVQKRLGRCCEPTVADRIDHEDGLLDGFHGTSMALAPTTRCLPLAARPLQSHRMP